MHVLLLGPVLAGLLLIAAGLLTLAAKRPLVLAARWIPLALLACFVPEQVALLVGPSASVSLLHRSLGLLFIAASGLLCWILFGGYVVYGATEGQLDAAMAEALGRLRQPFEKTSNGVRLTAQDAELKARMGVQDVWSLSMSPRARRRTLVAVAGGMRAHLGSRAERGARSGSYAMLAVGAFFLVLRLLIEATVVGF